MEKIFNIGDIVTWDKDYLKENREDIVRFFGDPDEFKCEVVKSEVGRPKNNFKCISGKNRGMVYNWNKKYMELYSTPIVLTEEDML